MEKFKEKLPTQDHIRDTYQKTIETRKRAIFYQSALDRQ